MEYGDPPRPLLGDGIYESVEELLDARFGEGNYQIKDFKITYSEEIAKWMNTFAPALMGIGMLLLFLEFKTPGFGFFGIAGIVLIGIFFASLYVAGLAGNEPIVLFVIGVLLVLTELLFFPGMLFMAVPGIAMMLGSLLWAMVDFWPKGTGELTFESFADPFVTLVFGLSIAVFGAILLSRVMKGSSIERSVVLTGSVGSTSSEDERVGRENDLPRVGLTGTAVTKLFPSGRVELSGKRYDARCAVGMVDKGVKVRVVGYEDFDVIVEEVDS